MFVFTVYYFHYFVLQFRLTGHSDHFRKI